MLLDAIIVGGLHVYESVLKKRKLLREQEVDAADKAKELDKKGGQAMKAAQLREQKELQRKLHQQGKIQQNSNPTNPSHHIQQPDKAKKLK
jgi:hypothetical protein